MVLDEMLKAYSFDYIKKEDNYELGKVYFDKTALFFLKPLTFMNLSGIVLPEVLSFLELKVTELIVIYDDVALPLGKIRIRTNGSSGGHNGVRSIINSLGTQNFSRLRVGIGPKPSNISLTDYVLSKFEKAEHETLKKILKISVDAVKCIVNEGFDKAMRIYNSLSLESS